MRRFLGMGLALLLSAHPGWARGQSRVIILATTTSVQDSGLLDLLIPLFERRTAYTVKTIAVGTGQSLAMAARGDADLVLAHAPALEDKYVREGTLASRRLVMVNDFLIVGPPQDPAGIRGIGSAVEAFRRIRGTGATFVSRGDHSGTHTLELLLWKTAGGAPDGPRYLQSGQGMGATLRIASEKRAYTLTDRGTFLAFKKVLGLEVLVERDRALVNFYSVLEVNPARHPRVNHAGARALAGFLLSPEVQAIIGSFGVEKYGEPLFFPAAGKEREHLGLEGVRARWS